MHDPRLERLRQTAGKVIGAVFYETLLRTMRSSPLRSEFGRGGHAEKVFEGQLDAELASRAGSASRNGLAAVMLERLADQQLRVDRQRTFTDRRGMQDEDGIRRSTTV